jgi:cell division protein FtsW
MARRLFWLILTLLVLGLIVLSSASAVQATKQFGSSSYFWVHQLTRGIIPGVALMLLFWRIRYDQLKPWALAMLAMSLLVMVLVFVPQLGLQLKGAKSWISLGGFITFQPAEALKLGLVIYLAAWLGERSERVKNWQLGLLPFAVIMSFICLLLLLQPDLGTLGIVLMMAMAVYFIAGAPLKQLAVVCLVGVLLIGVFARVSPERWSRVTTMFNPTADARGDGWQLNQSLIAIGSGGMFGKGYGQSTQKFGLLPEPVGDSIFAVLVEELGMVGGAITLGLFGLLAWTLISIARHTHDGFGQLVASGMCVWILVQSLVNIMAITGIGPLTGVPLPFISYGGSSMAFMLAGLGIVLNIAEQNS